MSRRDLLDVVVVGAGMVGSSAALALARAGASVALVEARAPSPWRQQPPDLRVVALASDAIALLDQLGVWSAVRDGRAQVYRSMRVWDAGGGDALQFDAREEGRSELGWIVENELLIDRLWGELTRCQAVRRHCPARVVGLEQDADSVQVQLDDGLRLRSRLLLAADGAGSPLRALLGIETAVEDYRQSGLVAYVRCQYAHAETCYQRFLPGGPLAFLPFADGRCSIVWSLPSAEAERLQSIDGVAFCRELERAFDGHLGAISEVSERRCFPLRRQLAQQYRQGRAMLIGDAAHVVHPLAGQGVNLGFRDVLAVAAHVRACLAAGVDPGDAQRLQRVARERRSECTVAAAAFSGINRVFSNQAVLPTLLRGPLLGLANRLHPLKSLLWRRAAGE